MTSSLVKLGPKGQILIKKEYRAQLGLKPGNYVQTYLTSQGLVIKPVNAAAELEKVRKIREKISKHWPKNVDCVDAVRDVRR